MAEKTITIRVPEEIHKAIKLKAVEEGISIKDYLVKLAEKDLQEQN